MLAERKNMDIMGPLCKIWESLETNKEQESFVSINGLIKFVKFQSIISVG